MRIRVGMQKMNTLPILATVPRSGTWFFRYAMSFLCHLDRGGRIDDRLTGKVFGVPSGPLFDFQRFAGGPLFWVRGTLPAEHLFIGHTVCPGFSDLATKSDWWQQTPFHVAGYDYFHEGMNYLYTPVELSSYRYTPVSVPTLEHSAAKGSNLRIVFIYRNPIDQAASYYRYCQDHKDPAYNIFRGRPLSTVPFVEYLFEGALPSYVKQFTSFQAMAARHPHLVRLMPYERVMDDPLGAMTVILNHLSGAPRQRLELADAVWLARSEHMNAIEKELGRSLDGTRNGGLSHMRATNARLLDGRVDEATRDKAIVLMRDHGIDLDLIEWPATHKTASAA